jgi:hypothetical protein
MGSEQNKLIDIIEDQAHAMQKLCEMIRDEMIKKHVVLENCKISGDRFAVDGNVDVYGTLDISELKNSLDIKGYFNCNDGSTLRCAKDKKVKLVKKPKIKNSKSKKVKK